MTNIRHMKIGPQEADIIARHPRIKNMPSRWLLQCYSALEHAASDAVRLWLEVHETLSDVEGEAEVTMDGLRGVVFFRDHPVLRFEFFDRPGSVLSLMPRRPSIPLHPYDPVI